MRYDFLNISEINSLQRWHSSLEQNRGYRARLRKAERAEDVILTDAFSHFLQKMSANWLDNKPLFSSATVAGLLARVKTDTQVKSRTNWAKDDRKPYKMATFAEQLAIPRDSNKPPMSELRFQQLQKSTSTDDFYRRIRRAIALLDGKVNILSLANDIIHWHQEFDNLTSRHPSKRLAVRWATEYFSALPQK